jgi:hypothetical protein
MILPQSPQPSWVMDVYHQQHCMAQKNNQGRPFRQAIQHEAQKVAAGHALLLIIVQHLPSTDLPQATAAFTNCGCWWPPWPPGSGTHGPVVLLLLLLLLLLPLTAASGCAYLQPPGQQRQRCDMC